MATTDRYKVDVRVSIQKVTEHGSYTNDRLSFEDSTDLGSLNFEQIAGLLMRFHDLSQTATAELVAGDTTAG